MGTGSTIVSVTARQLFSERGHPGVGATLKTGSGAVGVAICTAGVSVGQHEVPFVYDGSSKWRGRGVQRAVENIHTLIAPALRGLDATRQGALDDALFSLRRPGAKQRLGRNVTGAASAAMVKAGAAGLAGFRPIRPGSAAAGRSAERMGRSILRGNVNARDPRADATEDLVADGPE
jgi:enolase